MKIKTIRHTVLFQSLAHVTPSIGVSRNQAEAGPAGRAATQKKPRSLQDTIRLKDEPDTSSEINSSGSSTGVCPWVGSCSVNLPRGRLKPVFHDASRRCRIKSQTKLQVAVRKQDDGVCPLGSASRRAVPSPTACPAAASESCWLLKSLREKAQQPRSLEQLQCPSGEAETATVGITTEGSVLGFL